MTKTNIELGGVLYRDYINTPHLDSLVQGDCILLEQDIVQDTAILSEGLPDSVNAISKGRYIINSVTLLLPSEDRVLHLRRDDNTKSFTRLTVGVPQSNVTN